MQKEKVKRRLNPKIMANRPSPIHAILITEWGQRGRRGKGNCIGKGIFARWREEGNFAYT